jgi:ABC-type lipoprotein release transport system permease subunit
MTLTFLNLIVIRGILVGLTQGSVQANRDKYTGTVFISALDKKQYIEDSHLPVGIAKNIQLVEALSARYTAAARVEADYKIPTPRGEDANRINATIVGINPADEEATTRLSKSLIQGSYLDSGMRNQILVGASLLKKYSSVPGTGSSLLKNADVGTTVRLTVNNNIKDVTIIGVLKAKVQTIDSRIFMLDSELRPMIDRNDFNVNEIAIKTKSPADDKLLQSILLGNEIDLLAKVQTWEEAQPQFLRDISATFSLLGDLIGSIGLVVASITIFIVIFVNAITRRKYIGILKGIGINGLVIEISYVFQSLFYAAGGTLIGMLIVYGLIVPYFSKNPINFPFSDGIFVADIQSVLVRILLLYSATVVAGYVPARIVVKQRTLDAILGR